MPTNIEDVPQGSMITFRSKSPVDAVVWRGVLEMVGTYRSIRRYTNPAPENQAVRQVDPTVPTDETTLTYFLITVDNNSTEATERVFAQEWIQPGSLTIINPGNTVNLTVDDPNSDPLAIVSLLASAGYSCRIVS